MLLVTNIMSGTVCKVHLSTWLVHLSTVRILPVRRLCLDSDWATPASGGNFANNKQTLFSRWQMWTNSFFSESNIAAAQHFVQF